MYKVDAVTALATSVAALSKKIDVLVVTKLVWVMHCGTCGGEKCTC